MSAGRAARHGGRGRARGALRVVLAGVFLLAAYGKLSGAPDAVAVFDAVGVGQWLRYLTGTVEALGAGLLLAPRAAGPGALLLAGVMLGAIAAHLGPVAGSPAVPATLLGLLVAVLVTGPRTGPRGRTGPDRAPTGPI